MIEHFNYLDDLLLDGLGLINIERDLRKMQETREKWENFISHRPLCSKR